MDPKYDTLVKILDEICRLAPDNYKIYKPKKNDAEGVARARSRAIIHLYLKAKFDVSDFKTAEDLFVTEGNDDGGIDGYFLDDKGLTKTLFLIQSKFRGSGRGFEKTEIEADELAKMDLKRIFEDGEAMDERGVEYNGKVLNLKKTVSKIPNFSRDYKVRVIIIANLNKMHEKAVSRLIDGYNFEIFNFEKTYKELVLGVCSGTYYDPKEIVISISLNEKTEPRVRQVIKTMVGSIEVHVLFVPVIEIAKILHKYKNSILRFNPRNYLSLAKNEINKKIAFSIEKDDTNDFALFNNGLTFLAEEATYDKPLGQKISALFTITAPQIINGAQTAYTLANLLGKEGNIFAGKEVMIRVIKIDHKNSEISNFIEKLSDSTNQQNRINEADRRSNDPIQERIQENIFSKFGYFYSRKRGEFENGLSQNFLAKKFVIDREQFVKSYIAYHGQPSEARRSSETLFREKFFKDFFRNKSNYLEMFFAYRCLNFLNKMNGQRKTSRKSKEILRYGRLAVVSAIGAKKFDIVPANLEQVAESCVRSVLDEWPKFVRYIGKQKNNRPYMKQGVVDYDNYTKGRTINLDIKSYFGRLSKAAAKIYSG